MGGIQRAKQGVFAPSWAQSCIQGAEKAVFAPIMAGETYSVAQVPVVPGTGIGVCRSRCGKTVAACAATARRTPFRGAGPQAEITPAPRIASICARQCYHLRQTSPLGGGDSQPYKCQLTIFHQASITWNIFRGIIGSVYIKDIVNTKVANFSVATDYCYTAKDGTKVIDVTWHRVVAWEWKQIQNLSDWPITVLIH